MLVKYTTVGHRSPKKLVQAHLSKSDGSMLDEDFNDVFVHAIQSGALRRTVLFGLPIHGCSGGVNISSLWNWVWLVQKREDLFLVAERKGGAYIKYVISGATLLMINFLKDAEL